MCIRDRCYTTVAAGLRHVLAIKSNGTLWGWGDNGYGQLGDGTTVSRSLPVQIGTATNWAKLEAGDINSFGIKTDGTLWAWGNNSFYQLGNNTNLSSNVPIPVSYTHLDVYKRQDLQCALYFVHFTLYFLHISNV